MTKDELKNLKVPGEIDPKINFNKIQRYYIANSKTKEFLFDSYSVEQCKVFLNQKKAKRNKDLIILKQARNGLFLDLDKDFLKPFYKSLQVYNQQVKPLIIEELINWERAIREDR
jgi:hypothetical protein